MKLSENLIILKRKPHEAILMNGKSGRYLNIPENASAIIDVLLSFNKNRSDLLKNKEYESLINMCKKHDIIVNSEDKETWKNPKDNKIDSSRNIIYIDIDSHFNKQDHLGVIRNQLLGVPQGGELILIFRTIHSCKSIAWDNLKKIINGVESFNQLPYSFRPKLFLECDISIIPMEFLDFMLDHEIVLLAKYELPEGIICAKEKEVENNRIRYLTDHSLSPILITPVTSKNVTDLNNIAQYHAQLNDCGGFHFPPVEPVKNGKYIPKRFLPPLTLYAEKIQDVYCSRLVDRDLFFTTASLTSRIMRVRQQLTCGYDIGTIKSLCGDGEKFPCPKFVEIKNVVGTEFCDRNLPPDEKCMNCNFRYICGGMCHAARLLSMQPGCPDYIKDYVGPIFCETRKKLIESIIWDIYDSKLTCLV